MSIESLIFNVALLFLMLIPGFLMTKCHLATEGLGKGLANLVLYIAQPALIVSAYIRPFDTQILENVIVVFLLSVVSHILFAVVAFLSFRRAEERHAKMLRFATVFSNAAYMGIPLIVGLLGTEAAIYASIYSITFNLFIWSLGVFICTGDKKQASLRKVATHPVTISSILGLLFFFLPIDMYVPELFVTGLSMLKELVAPLSMIIIGLRLADLSLRGILRDRHLYEFLVLRLLVLPTAVFFITYCLRFLGAPISNVAATVILISAATPAATATSMFAEKFDGDTTYAGALVAISTILSILTMPLVALLLSLL